MQSGYAQLNLDSLANDELPDLLNQYKTLHSLPELSGHEEKTSAFMAAQLKALGYTVTEHVGKFTNRPWKDYGVIAIMKNGNGPVVLVQQIWMLCL